MKIKTKDLIGAALDWAVATCEGYTLTTDGINQLVEKDRRLTILGTCTTGQGIPCGYSPSSYWSQGGPIIEREKIGLDTWQRVWAAQFTFPVKHPTNAKRDPSHHRMNGPTPLVAAMRCYVASQLGEEIEMPDELVKGE